MSGIYHWQPSDCLPEESEFSQLDLFGSAESRKMKTRSLGPLQVSILGLGCNSFGLEVDEVQATRVVNAALEAGISYFDTADSYSDGVSEQMLGRALGSNRSEVVVATKFVKQLSDPTSGGASDRWIRIAVENSLQRLGTDWIDLYQLHQPDPDVPIAETLGALDDLVTAGKVRAIGHSNLTAAQMFEAAEIADKTGTTAFVSAQNEWNILFRDVEKNIMPAIGELGLSMLPYRPLASGVLTGKYTDGGAWDPGWRLGTRQTHRGRFLEGREAVVESLAEYAAGQGRVLLDLALSWLAVHPTVASVVAGATSPEQVMANVRAASWQLTPADLTAVDRLAPVSG